MSGRERSWVELVLERADGPAPATADTVEAQRAFWDSAALAVEVPETLEFHEHVTLRSRAGKTLTAEVLVPKRDGVFPGFLYLHGGGWCIWNARNVRKKAIRIAESGYVVVNVDYGLAPEHPFPWAVEDAVYAARWTRERAGAHRVSNAPLGIGGDSAGANLAAATVAYLNGLETRTAREYGTEFDEGDLAGVAVTFGAALLLYGVYDFGARLRERSSGPGTTEMSNLSYLGPQFLTRHSHPLVSPALSPNLSSFPPTYLCCGDRDSVLPQSLLMANALALAKVPTTVSVVAGADHEFLLVSDEALPGVSHEWERILYWLKQWLT
jgi:acetyl esterase